MTVQTSAAADKAAALVKAVKLVRALTNPVLQARFAERPLRSELPLAAKCRDGPSRRL
jgi:hypothetical protein